MPINESNKKIVDMKEKKKRREKVQLGQMKQVLNSKCVCYVLICCDEPSDDGKMEVEMHFEGDEVLASFLVENANQLFEERVLSLRK